MSSLWVQNIFGHTLGDLHFSLIWFMWGVHHWNYFCLVAVILVHRHNYHADIGNFKHLSGYYTQKVFFQISIIFSKIHLTCWNSLSRSPELSENAIFQLIVFQKLFIIFLIDDYSCVIFDNFHLIVPESWQGFFSKFVITNLNFHFAINNKNLFHFNNNVSLIQ